MVTRSTAQGVQLNSSSKDSVREMGLHLLGGQ